MTAVRQPPPRATRTLVLAAGAVLCCAVGFAYWRLWQTSPTAAGLLASHCACVLLGLSLRDRRRKALEAVSDWHDEELAAIKLADARADSGEHPQVDVEQHDWAAEDDSPELPRTVPPTYERRLS